MKSILENFKLDNEYRSIISGYGEGHMPCVISGMCDSSRPFLVASILKDLDKKGIIVVPEEKDAVALSNMLRLYFENVIYYPSRDFVFENVSAYSHEWEHERLRAQYAVLNDKYDVIPND